MRIEIRVQSSAATSGIVGMRQGVLNVRVTAAPHGGAANDAVVALIAKRLGIGKTRVRLVRGASARTKLIDIDDIDESAVRETLSIDNKR